jgi:hypothetical protein
MVVGYTTVYAIGVYVRSKFAHAEVYNNVLAFVTDLRKVVAFLGVSGFLQQLIWTPRYN